MHDWAYAIEVADREVDRFEVLIMLEHLQKSSLL
jgi:hypothetical protein